MLPTKKLLCELVALPSINPAFLPAGDPRVGEQRVAEYLAAVAAKSGMDVQLEDVLPHRPNILAHLCPSGAVKQRVLLVPHLDTVGVANDDQLKPREVNGRIFGRGSCDTKSNVAMMLTAMAELAKSAERPRETEIIFCGVIDEENAQAGSRALAASGMKAELAIIGEATQLKVVTAHKGSQWLRFETKGKAAHGSVPHLGVNAVHEMARVIDWLQTDYAKLLRKRTHPLLGHATISVGPVHGGVQPNIVPDHCVMLADRRAIPGETEATVNRELKALLKKNKLKATLTQDKNAPCLPMETDPNLPLVQQMLKSFKQKRTFGVDYYCDASPLSHGGIPSVVFGPGDIAQAHTVDEWISIAQLEQGTRLLLTFLQSLA